MDVKKKLVDLLTEFFGVDPMYYGVDANALADHFIANNVTVQEVGFWEKVVEIKDNTVCGNGIKIEFEVCSCCKKPHKFLGNEFCGNCGAQLILPQPPKGE